MPAIRVRSLKVESVGKYQVTGFGESRHRPNGLECEWRGAVGRSKMECNA